MSISNNWTFYVSNNLSNLNLSQYNYFLLSEKVENNLEEVNWNKSTIHTSSQARLYTKNASTCIILIARGYVAGKLSHVGMAHQFIDTDLHKKFFQEMRKQVGEGNTVELFIGAGKQIVSFKGSSSNEDLKTILKTAEQYKFSILDNKWGVGATDLYVKPKGEDTFHSASIGCSVAWLDSNFNPCLCFDVESPSYQGDYSNLQYVHEMKN